MSKKTEALKKAVVVVAYWWGWVIAGLSTTVLFSKITGIPEEGSWMIVSITAFAIYVLYLHYSRSD